MYVYGLPKVKHDDDVRARTSAKDHMEDFYIDVPESQIIKYTNPEASGNFGCCIMIF